jgi:predicted nuclease of predicted toxin-antitoxin system
MRFHLDQHIDSNVARGLKLRGIDVSTTFDAGLQDASDEDHIEHSNRERRVIVTQDRDFLRHHSAGAAHFGIVYSAQGSKSVGEIVAFLELLDACLDESEMRNRAEFF